ncbi:hypothetical protein B0H14DRAFT_2744690 [Mycena olivaceomarginata]|nr:hypothetical protein B0H14DRAFT_2744690 [Mycena olivaceomarginata]
MSLANTVRTIGKPCHQMFPTSGTQPLSGLAVGSTTQETRRMRSGANQALTSQAHSPWTASTSAGGPYLNNRHAACFSYPQNCGTSYLKWPSQIVSFTYNWFSPSNTIAIYAPNDPRMVDPLDDIPVALFLACRAVYVEALPIMHRQNTYYFGLRDLPDILQCSLGQYCLPEIRKLYIHQDYFFRFPPVGLWDSVLTLEFTVDSGQVRREGLRVDKAWRLGLLAIRHLRTLNIVVQTLGPDSSLDAEKIIDADEKYEAFLLAEPKTPEIATWTWVNDPSLRQA